MAWYHVGSCDCPIGCCDCGDTRMSGSIMYDPVKDQYIWVGHRLIYKFGEMMPANSLWNHNDYEIMFISIEEWDTK